MSCESDLRTFLAAVPAIAASGADDRIFPVFAPDQAVAPYITYRRLSTRHDYSLDGFSGPAEPRFRVTFWSDDYDLACEVMEAVKAAIGEEAGMTFLDMADTYEPAPELQTMLGRYIDLSIDVA
jgi:hypothetical protein